MNADIRVYPDKEMKAVDMAEIIDSVQLSNGILQGCGVEIIQNAVHIADGRILIRGRLGVVTAGNVETPALEGTATCYLAAVCDLAIENPFYISLLTGADKDALDQKKSRVADFNVGDGVDYVILGTVQINPTTGVVSNWTPQNASPVSNNSVFGPVKSDVSSHTATLNSHTTTLNSHTTTLNSLLTRITKLEKIADNMLDVVSLYNREVPANGTGYIPLKATSAYLMVTSAPRVAMGSNGIYMLSTGFATFAITPISPGEDVVVSNPSGNLIVKVENHSSVVLSIMFVTLSGTRIH